MDQPLCVCGHSWIWHRATDPKRCDYGDCACRAFTAVNGEDGSRKKRDKRTPIGRLRTRNAEGALIVVEQSGGLAHRVTAAP